MKYENKAKCPVAVQEMIELVNVFPKDIKLPDPFKILDKIELVNQVNDIEEALFQKFCKAKILWFKELKSMPELRNFDRLQRFLKTLRPDLDSSNEKHKIHDIFNAYSRFNEIQEIFDQILERVKIHEQAFVEYGEDVYSWKGFRVNYVTMYAYGKEGKIKFALSEILEPFKDCELVRFKRCLICQNIFWAKKINAETCGLKNCASTLYNRKRLAKLKAKSEQEKLKRQQFNNQDFSKKTNKKDKF